MGPNRGRGALEGRWRRVVESDPPPVPESVPFGHDPRMFPDEIEFAGVRYTARKAPDQGFVVWDVGSFDVEDDVLTMTLANDASADYRVEVEGDSLTITGEAGKTRYRRAD